MQINIESGCISIEDVKLKYEEVKTDNKIARFLDAYKKGVLVTTIYLSVDRLKFKKNISNVKTYEVVRKGV